VECPGSSGDENGKVRPKAESTLDVDHDVPLCCSRLWKFVVIEYD